MTIKSKREYAVFEVVMDLSGRSIQLVISVETSHDQIRAMILDAWNRNVKEITVGPTTVRIHGSRRARTSSN